MAEQGRRVYPDDVQGRPTAPLAPRTALISEKGSPIVYHHHNFQPFDDYTVRRQPPPLALRGVSARRSRRNGGGGCCRCLCCFLCVLLVFIVAATIIAAAFYLIFQPKVPQYYVDRLTLRAFRISSAFPLTLYSQFVVTVTAKNPNQNIGIYYRPGSKLSVRYANVSLSTGELPAFYQGHRNTTRLKVVLTGQNEVGMGLWRVLMQQQQTGKIPLEFQGVVPVVVEVAGWKMKQVSFIVGCNLIVDRLTVDGQISIKANDCHFRFHL